MSLSDLIFIFQWWMVFLGIGIVFLPLAVNIFPHFFDKGYIFAKVLGIIIVSYTVFLLGIVKVLPFTMLTILLVTGFFAGINILILKNHWKSTIQQFNNRIIAIFLFEEILFFLALLFWSYIRAHQPDINGLEKFMDFGFINSILRSEYFPPKDMWLTPFPINYYYFGHLVTAVLTKLSGIPSSITYNLMLSTIFALTFTGAFSIGVNLYTMIIGEAGDASRGAPRGGPALVSAVGNAWGWRAAGPAVAGILTAFLVSMAGNLHTIYTFFKPYPNEAPVPFWQLVFSPHTFPNAYWYPNATRFISNTIHEFPIYSFVVSDLHGHVLDIPVVLLTIAVLLSLISKHEIRNPKQSQNTNNKNSKCFGILSFGYLNLFRDSRFEFRILLLAFLLAVMYMTNAWDGIIYFLLTVFVIGLLGWKQMQNKEVQNTTNTTNIKYYKYFNIGLLVVLVCIGSILFSLPFSINFKPFVSGIGILCAPQFLTNIEKLGPFLFEADHCQRSPLWQMFILYGFFYFWAISFFVFLYKKIKSTPDLFVFLLIFLSTILIIIPEFFYIKDIYPTHYRANTMFKLVYQSFIMLSIVSGYIIIRIITNFKFQISNFKFITLVFIGGVGLFLVMIYPYFAINSYYGDLRTYRGLDGIGYLKTLYPTDYRAILWLNKNIKGQPVILEAQGDSYTDYTRVSANTGLPTVLGWTVHEWLWRGTYDIPAPRIEEVKKLYETESIKEARKLIEKYNISFVFIGGLERQKYSSLNEKKFQSLGKIVYQNGQTRIYRVD